MPKCSALFTSDTSVHHCHHFRAVVALDAKRPIVLSRPGIEPGRSSALSRRSFVLRLPDVPDVVPAAMPVLEVVEGASGLRRSLPADRPRQGRGLRGRAQGEPRQVRAAHLRPDGLRRVVRGTGRMVRSEERRHGRTRSSGRRSSGRWSTNESAGSIPAQRENRARTVEKSPEGQNSCRLASRGHSEVVALVKNGGTGEHCWTLVFLIVTVRTANRDVFGAVIF